MTQQHSRADGAAPDLAEIASALLEAARRAGADAADVMAVRKEGLDVEARGGALEMIERVEGLDFGLRALVKGEKGWREASVSASDPNPETLSALAERAVAMACEAPEDVYGGLSAPAERCDAPDKAAAGLALDEPGDAPSPEALLEIAKVLEAAALGVKGVEQADGASAMYSRSSQLLATSDGFLGRYASSRHAISVSAVAGSGAAMERDYASSAARRRDAVRSVEEVGREAGERAVKRLSPRRAKSGAYPVFFERRVASSIVSGLLGALNGDQIARGASFLASRMGEKILPDGVDLIDDPSLPGALGSRPFDGEGLGGRRKRLIADGVVAEWLLDAGAARRLGLASNGCAARGVGGSPRPGASNAWLTAGAKSPEALIAEMGEGLIVTEMMGRGLNPVTGDYSRGASGFWVEGGQIAYPVSELTIAGDIFEMLKGLEAADDLSFERRVEAPSLRMEGLTVGSA